MKKGKTIMDLVDTEQASDIAETMVVKSAALHNGAVLGAIPLDYVMVKHSGKFIREKN
jgi:hypothetical protein